MPSATRTRRIRARFPSDSRQAMHIRWGV
jgi:hypothetical protein